MRIIKRANDLTNELISWRRHLHQYPELSFQEYETAKYIANELEKIKGMNVEEGIGGFGVVGTLSSGNGPTIAIRADIDALPIQEENECSYRSKHDGVMHACGHDAHPAIALGVAKLLSEDFHKGYLKGKVKFIFQPAEESTDDRGLSGAPYMIIDGVLEDVEAVLALHMCPWLSVGEVQIHNGYSMANVDEFRATIRGVAGHGAYPEQTVDPIWLLSQVLPALYSLTNRRISPAEPAVLSIGKIAGGSARNIIPSEITIEGTIRTYKSKTRKKMDEELRKVLSITENLGGSYSLEITKGEPALKNNATLNEGIKTTCTELFPDMKLIDEPFGLGGEDFGYMTHMVPGTMFFLGAGIHDEKARHLHSPHFDIDEKCLPLGVAMMAETLGRFLDGQYSLPTKTVENWKEDLDDA